MTTLLVTGNLWLNHTESISRLNRPFIKREDFLQDFKDKLQPYLHNSVSPRDLYVLGNFGVGKELKDFIESFNVIFKLVPSINDDVSRFRKFRNVEILDQVHVGTAWNSKKYVMSAYPMLDWPYKYQGATLLYGTPTEYAIDGALDCSYDNHGLSLRIVNFTVP